MKTVMIHAYTQFNLGDDLFIKILCERYPETAFVIFAPRQYKRRLKHISNLHVFTNNSLITRGISYVCRKLSLHSNFLKLLTKKCDAIIWIGGSIFIQDGCWQKDLKYRKALVSQDKPSFLLGANFGPYDDQQFYLGHKSLFKRYTDICFRDQYSYSLFNDLSHVRVASDIIFQLDQPAVKHIEDSVVISIIKPSIRKHLANKDAIYYQKIKEISMIFIDHGYTVTLVSFCEFESDHDAIEIIEKLIPTSYLSKLTKHYYKGNIDETLYIIAKSSFVIATRFHAMILGWIYGKPVFPIVYSEKMKHVMNDIEFTGSYSDFDQLDKLEATQVFSSMKTNTIDINAQIKDAAKHFDILDTYLLSDEKG